MAGWRSLRASFQVRLVAAFAAVYLIWGGTYLAIRFAIESMPPFLMAATRFLVAGSLLYGWMRVRGEARPTRGQWKAAALVGALLFLGGNGGVTWAEQHIPSSLAASLIATVPMWIVLLDWLRPGGVRPGAQVIMGLLVGFVGVVLLVGPRGGGAHEQVNPLGAAAVLLAALFWASGSLASRGAGLPSSALLSSGMQMLIGGALLLAAGTVTGEWARFDVGAITPRSWLALLYLIFLGAMVAFGAYAWLLRVSTPARVATYAYVNPVIAVFLGWSLGNEPLTAQTLVAAACIIGAVAVITTYRARPRVPVAAGATSSR